MGTTGLPVVEIIAISGKQFAGKDALADQLLRRLPCIFEKKPFAGAIKSVFAQQQQITLEEIEARKSDYRPGLIALGQWGRAQHPDYWIRQVVLPPKGHPDREPYRVLIPDLRMKREYEYLRNLSQEVGFPEAKAFLIRLNADREIRMARGGGRLVSEMDPTECDLDGETQWDWMGENNGDKDALGNLVDSALIPKLQDFFSFKGLLSLE